MNLITLIISTFFDGLRCCWRLFLRFLDFVLVYLTPLDYCHILYWLIGTGCCFSCFNCLSRSFNDSSLLCFVDEFDLDGTFPLVLLFSELSICMVSFLLGRIMVSLDFLLITMLLLLRFNMSEHVFVYMGVYISMHAPVCVCVCTCIYVSIYI